MKNIVLFITLILTLSIGALSAANLVNENISTWTSHASYGAYTQTITAGTVSMTACIVAPTGAANGTGSVGYVQMQATNGILEIPSLASIGTIEFRIHAGGAGRTLKLQQYVGSTWTDLTTFTIGTTGTTFTYNLNTTSAARIRLSTPSAAVYVHDIIITDYASGTAPDAPNATSATSLTSTGFTANWDASSGATSYRLDVSTSNTFGTFVTGYNDLTVSGLTQAVSGLTAATTYYYRVRANNTYGTSSNSSIITAVTSSGVVIPDAPTATAATSITSSGFTANWTTVSGATSYRLDVSTSNTFTTFVTGYNNLTVTGLYQAVTGLAVSTNYYYRVRAYNTAGTSGNSGTITVTTSASDPYSGYYDPVTGLTGDALKTGLHNLIATNTYSNYDGAKLYMFQTADNVAGVVRCVYTGQDYTISSSYDGASNPNTEHTFAQSWFGTTDASKKKADIHHLFPTNSTVNSTRGNYPFDVVTTVSNTFPSYNGYVSKKGTNASGKIVFEPADQQKGDLARALLYFSVRYNMSLSISSVDMLPTMITWNSSDPVDAKELARNASIYSFLGNRNPFVDHPEYVTSIWGGSTANTTIQFSPASASVNENAGTVTLTVGILNPSATTATTAQIQLTDGTASDVNSYTTQTITFPAGSSANQTITVTVTDDAVLEGDETLVFSLASISGGTSATAGAYDSYNLTILDNDIPNVTASAATSISDTGFTANWSAASGITTYEFDLSTSSDFSTFVTGYDALQVTGTSVALTGLSAGTTYYYRVRSFYNETGGTSSSTITTLTTGTGTGTVILTAGFEGATTPPTGWAISAAGAYIQSNSTNAHAGTNYAGTNKVNGWVRTPLLTNPTQLTFWGRTSAASANYTITIQAATADSASWSNITTFVATPTDAGTVTSTYTQKTVALNLTGSYYLRWYMTVRSGGSLYFDDVEVTSGAVTPTPPAAPVATAGTSITTSGFTANWNASATATSYRLDVSTSDVFASYVTGYSDLTVSGLTQAVSGLTAATTYYYRVRAVNADGTSANSNVISALTETAPVAPAAPVATTATDLATTGFTANWNASATATSYRLDVSTSDVFASYVTGYQNLTVSGLTQAVSGLTASTTYYYRARAVNAAGTSLDSNVITAITTGSSGTVILTAGFEGATTPPTGWAISAAGAYIQSNSTNAHAGTNYAGTNKVNGWVRTPLLTNPTQLTFWGRTSAASANYTITIQAATADSASWSNITTFVATPTDAGTVTSTYTQKTVALNLTGSYYLRWYMTVRSGGSLYFDDVEVTSGAVTPTPPAAPVATAGTSITTSGFTANWNASATATSYRLDVSTSDVFASYVTGYSDLTVSGLTQAVSGLTAATTYYYRVRAVNADGTSANSNVISALTETAPVAPAAPVATTATDLATTGFTANWNASATATSYRLDVSTSDVFASYVTGYQNLTVSGLTQAVSGLTASTTYYYRVRAVNAAGTSLDSNVITAITTGSSGTVILTAGFEGATTPPTGWAISAAGAYIQSTSGNAHAGTNYAGTNKVNGWVRTPLLTNPTQLTFWGRTSAASANYTITIQATTADSASWSNITTYVATPTDAGTITSTYTQKTVALNLTGSYYLRWYMTVRSGGSLYFDDVEVTSGEVIPTPPAAPVATAGTSITTSGFTANWGTVTEATGYRLDVSTSDTFGTFVTGYNDLTVAGLTQAVTGLAENTNYYYRVRAVNAIGPSDNSNTITVLTNTTSTSDLFISEYLEGNSNNKAVELYNPTASSIDLTQYKVKLAPNGEGWNTTSISPTGTLAAGGVYVISHNQASSAILALANLTSGALTFNGNDAVGLFKGITPVLIDVVGFPDTVTATGWNVAGVTTATANHTLIRKLSITKGNTNWTTSAGTDSSSSEWIVYPIDTISGLGLHNVPTIPPTAPVAIAATDTLTTSFTAKWNAVATATSYRLDVSTVNTFLTLVTGYSDLTVAGLSQSVTGLSETTTYYYRVRAVDANGTSANSNTITVITGTTPVAPAAPVASAATSIGTTGFTANWAASATATSYRLDVSTSLTFASFVTGFNDLTVAGLTQAVSGLTAATTYYYRVRAVNTVGTSANSDTITVVTTAVITTPELFISEYIEGSSNNKAIEIYNPTSSTIDLTQYVVKEAFNGATWSTTVALTGTLAANDVIVISHSTANAAILAVADVSLITFNFNGNDAVGLFKKITPSDTLLIDVVGIPGLGAGVPGAGWNVAGVTTATKDHTLVRKSETIHGNLDWTASAGTTTVNSEWTVYDVDTFTYIGSHTGASTTLDKPEITITTDGIDVILTWNSIVGAISYRVEASNDPFNTELFLDVTTNGTFAEDAGVVTWKQTPVDNLKFFRVIALPTAK